MSVDQDKDVLAGEYVLGTLDSFARAEAQALIGLDPAFAAAVQAWERRLGELSVLIPSREPPDKVWGAIKETIAKEAPARREVKPRPAKGEMPVFVRPSAAKSEPAPTIAPEKPAEQAEAAPKPPLAEPAAPSPAPVDAEKKQSEAEKRQSEAEKKQSGPKEPEPKKREAAPGHADVPGENVVQLRRRVGLWRAATAAFGALAASLVALLALQEFNPDILPAPLKPKVIELTKVVEVEKVRTVEVPGPVPAEFVAVLQKDNAAPAFLLTFDIAKRSLTVRRVGADREPGKSYELWLVSEKYPSPRSLGVIGAEPFTVRRISDDYDPVTINRATYAVSLEPQGGSPTGKPTGPVLYSSKLVQATPPGMASTP